MNCKANFIIVFCFWVLSGHAQTIQLVMSPNPSPYISDWENRSETATLIITNMTGSDIDIKVKAEILNGQGEIIAHTVSAKMPVLHVSSGISQYRAEDIFPLYAVDYDGSLAQTTAQTGRIPDDHYQFCVSLINPQTFEPIGPSGKVCRTFTIIDYQAPLLITPFDQDSIPFADVQGILFRWTPVTPSPPQLVTYRLLVFEMLPGQDNALMAISNNQPIVEKDIKGVFQTQWPVEFPQPEEGRKYAWTILPLNDQGRKIVDGYGFAQPYIFKVRSSFLRTDTSSPGTVVVGDKIKAGENGEFEVEVLTINTESDGTLTGTGKVYINWLLATVKVEFKNISIDQNKYLISGGIIAMQGSSAGTSPWDYPKAWGLAVLSGPLGSSAADGVMNWTNHKIENLVNGYVNNTLGFTQPMMLYKSNIPTPNIPDNSLKMPFGLSFPINGNNQKLLITEIIFKPDESKLNFIVSSEFQHSGSTYHLGFVGKYFLIHPNSIDFGNGRVELAEDFTMPNLSSNPKMEFLFKKGTPNSGCYLQWSENGLDDIRMEMEVTFSRDWLSPIPSPSINSKVTSLLTGNALSMEDFMFTGNLPQCEIVGTNGLKMQVGNITLDFSDVQNPANLTFPANYPHASTDLTWQGFYMKNFTITLPETWKTGNNQQPPNISAASLIIDDMGLTTEIVAINIYDLVSGKVADLSASLDTVKVTILNSSLVNGRATGRIVLPVSEVSATNTLKYKAIFSQSGGNGNLQFVIVPTGDISAELLKAKITLQATSNITASLSPGLISCSMTLNGVLKWNDPNLIPSITDNLGSLGAPLASGLKGVKMELSFENLKLTYQRNTISDDNSMTFNLGNWSFASPQKWVSNLPVSIDKIYYLSLPTTNPQGGKQLLRGALMLDVVVNLTEEIGGKTSIGAAFGINFYSSPLQIKPVFAGVVIKNVEVHADLSAVKIDGSLALRSGDPVFGDGFLATIEVTFTAVSLQCRALTEFGTTAYKNNGDIYRYWRVEADVIFSPGIPFMTGLAFYGFGGGAFYNMEAQLIPKGDGAYKFTFTPKKSSLGFKVKAVVGTSPSFDTFNADVELLATFSTSQGLTYIGFNGEFWVAANLTQRPTAYIHGGVGVSYNFPDKVFDLTASVMINIEKDGMKVITTPNPVGLQFHINGRTNKWFFISGTPINTNTVNIFGISLYSYLMFGNDIPVPQGFTNRFVNNYYGAVGSYPANNVGNGGVGINTATGKGFATGVGIEFSKQVDTGVLYRGSCREWKIGGQINAGAELNLAFMHQTGCEGINGFRASGYLGLYASMNAGIYGESFSDLCDDKSYQICKIKAGAWVVGKFPNPEYISGHISANINLFNGLCSCQYSKDFTRGTDCQGTETIYTNADQEDEADSLRNKLIAYIAPQTQDKFPASSTINVKYNLEPEKLFDVPENQGDGTIKNRTFMLQTERKLEMRDENGDWKELQLYVKVNTQGEFQNYIHDKASLLAEALKAKETNTTLLQEASTLKENALSLTIPIAKITLEKYFTDVNSVAEQLRKAAETNIAIAKTNLNHAGNTNTQAQTNKTGADNARQSIQAFLATLGRGEPVYTKLVSHVNSLFTISKSIRDVAVENWKLAGIIMNSIGPTTPNPNTVQNMSLGSVNLIQNSSNTILSGNITSSNSSLTEVQLPATIPNSTTPNFPNPSPPIENHLEPNKAFRFTVRATLMEMDAGWKPAMTRTGLPVSETKIFPFTTGLTSLVTVGDKK